MALLQHVFTELMPLPLGPLAEKAPLNLTAAWQDLTNLLVHHFGYEQQKHGRFRGRGHACRNVSWFLCNFGPTKEDLKLEILDFCVVDA